MCIDTMSKAVGIASGATFVGLAGPLAYSWNKPLIDSAVDKAMEVGTGALYLAGCTAGVATGFKVVQAIYQCDSSNFENYLAFDRDWGLDSAMDTVSWMKTAGAVSALAIGCIPAVYTVASMVL